MRNLRKPLVPLFKVCDLRRNLSDYIEKIIYSIRFMFCADFRKPSERSSGENQWDVSLFFDIQLSLGALSLPFFKLSHTFFAVEKVHDRRNKRASQRIDLVLRYSRVVFPSRHSPLLCNLLDSFSPCIRLFSFTFRRGRCRLT